jgi:hypothetical protein
MSERQLKMYENGGDTMIAYDAEDAAKVWEEVIGEPWWDENDEGWKEREEPTLTIWFDDERPATWPKNATAEQPSVENGDRLIITASTKDWIDAVGRGWLCSENY